MNINKVDFIKATNASKKLFGYSGLVINIKEKNIYLSHIHFLSLLYKLCLF